MGKSKKKKKTSSVIESPSNPLIILSGVEKKAGRVGIFSYFFKNFQKVQTTKLFVNKKILYKPITLSGLFILSYFSKPFKKGKRAVSMKSII